VQGLTRSRGGQARDDVPAEPIAAVTASLLVGIAEARSPLAAELPVWRTVRGLAGSAIR
jgi:hypothetical protein